MRELLALTIMSGFLFTLSGCNTMEGIGEDLEAGGEAIEEEAREHD